MIFLLTEALHTLYAEAVVTTPNQLLFLSLRGQEMDLQAIVDKLVRKDSLPLIIDGMTRRQEIDIGHASDLCTYLCHKPKTTCFPELSQLWIYDPLAQQPDVRNRRCLLLRDTTESAAAFEARIWQTVQTFCSLPWLLQEGFVQSYFRQQGWVQLYRGRGADACRIDLSAPDFASTLSRLLRTHTH